MGNRELYQAIIEFEESPLGKDIERFVKEDRETKIEALIHYGCLSTDKRVASIAWSLTFTSGIVEYLNSIKAEIEGPKDEKQDVPEYT
jgi:hypothetical protein